MKKLLNIVIAGLLLPACASQPEVREWTLTYVGAYTSIRGVKDPLSCFCSDGGYIDACGGQRIALCFEGEGPSAECRNIEVRGHYVDVAVEPDPESPCPGEAFRYLRVETWHCRD